MTNKSNNNSELLTWAVENIKEWDDGYTHLRSDNRGTFYSTGNTWTQVSLDYWGTKDKLVRWINIGFKNREHVQVITKQEWMEAKAMKTNLTTPTQPPATTPQEPVLGHVHAKAMVEYAQDALTNPDPWELWEMSYKPNGPWHSMQVNDAFLPSFYYRRKPKPTPKMVIGGIEVEASPFKPKNGEDYFLANLSNEGPYSEICWCNDGHDNLWFNRNLIFRTQKEAEAVAQALISLLQSAKVINAESGE